jgi:hypothetical protein
MKRLSEWGPVLHFVLKKVMLLRVEVQAAVAYEARIHDSCQRPN